MRVSMDKNEDNDKTSNKGPSTKYNNIKRASKEKNKEKDKTSS